MKIEDLTIPLLKELVGCEKPPVTDDKRKPDFYEQLTEINEKQIEKNKERVAENIRKEAEEIDPRVMFLKLKKAFIEQIGQINAANVLSKDSLFKARQVEDYVKKIIEPKINEMEKQLEKQLEFQKSILISAVKTLNSISQPWYRKVWNKITGQN